MDASPQVSDRRNSHAGRGLTLARGGELLLNSALESVVPALLVVILGGIGFGLVGHLWHQMLPSLPPVLTHSNPEVESSAGLWDVVRGAVARHRFAVVFAAVFLVKASVRLAKCSTYAPLRQFAAWLLLRRRRVSGHWFGIIFINALGAYIGALCWRWTQEFSWTQYVWSAVFDFLRPAIQSVINLVHGNDLIITTKSLVHWYNANLFKVAFWLFYLAAICDDLGLPGIKSLGRLIRRRFLRSWRTAATRQLQPSPPASHD